MKYPTKKNLIPLAKKCAKDIGYKLLSNGKIINNKRVIKNTECDSVYAFGICILRANLIIRKKGKYYMKEWYSEKFKVLPYPYKKGIDKRHTLPNYCKNTADDTVKDSRSNKNDKKQHNKNEENIGS